MHLNPYGRDAVHLAVDLANDPPSTFEGLTRRCRNAGIVVDMPVTAHDLTATLALVTLWCEIVDSPSEGRRAELLNALLADGSAHPRMTNHTGTGWHLHYRDDDIPLAQVLAALISVGTALHLAARGITSIGRCAAPGCSNTYADTSRTTRQRYCSTRCANRDAVRRHRTRKMPRK